MQAQMQAKTQIQPDEVSEQQSYVSDEEVLNYVKQNNPELYEKLTQLSPEDQARALSMMRGSEYETQENSNIEGDIE